MGYVIKSQQSDRWLGSGEGHHLIWFDDRADAYEIGTEHEAHQINAVHGSPWSVVIEVGGEFDQGGRFG